LFLIFQTLKESIVTYVNSELETFQTILSLGYPECLKSEGEEEVLDGEEEEKGRSSREACLKITLDFLRRMKQEELAKSLQRRKGILSRTLLFLTFT